jgi:hypothetical protein
MANAWIENSALARIKRGARLPIIQAQVSELIAAFKSSIQWKQLWYFRKRIMRRRQSTGDVLPAGKAHTGRRFRHT